MEQSLSLPLRVLLAGACTVVVLAGMKAAAPLLVLFLLAAFLAVLTAPIFIALQRFLSTWLSLVVMITGLALGGSLIGLLSQHTVTTFSHNMPTYQAELQEQYDAAREWLLAQGLQLSDGQDPLANFRPASLLQAVGLALRQASSLVTQGFLVFLLTAFLWLEMALLPAKLRAIVTNANWQRLEQAANHVRTYMGMKTVMSLVTGVLVTLWCVAMGVHFPLLLGVLAFVLNFVPTVGSIIAAIPAIALALVLHGPGWALLTTIGYLGINIGVSNVIEPRYFGYGLGLSPLVVIASMLFWGWLLGPLGMFLSVPLTMAVKLVLESDENSNWLAILLAASPPRGEGERTRRLSRHDNTT
jgi:AI-2 transport protein TqsA